MEVNIEIHNPVALAIGKEFPVPIHNLSELSSEKKHPCPNYELAKITESHEEETHTLRCDELS
jgi:hypothetical protein